MQFPISLVLNVSVSAVQTGVSAYNTANLALFTNDTAGAGFGTAGYKIYYEPVSVGVDFGSSSATATMANAIFAQQPNILAAGGYLVIIPLNASETVAAAITRTSSLVSYFGVTNAALESSADLLAAAALIQTLPMMGFFVENTAAAIAVSGSLDQLRSGGFTQTRGLVYLDTTNANINALTYQAAYASRALSTNFAGQNTTQTMHLKTLNNVQPDPNITAAQITLAQAAGADCYVNLQGSSRVLSSGLNGFYDSVFNTQWFSGALQVAAFNFLANANGKIPQTELGMDGMKAALRTVCEQAVTNGFSAPGSWTAPQTFGSQSDLIANVAQRGYYIYSSPINAQLQAARLARQAPVIQIAIKQAGAIHSGNVTVNVNA